jgi:hypothetical protein
MEPFRTLDLEHSLAAPLDRTNVDTDQIIPKQFLKRIERTGYGEFLFFDWRRTARTAIPNPEFELNDPRYKGAQILIAGKNFACGSSREHAAWALSDYGFRASSRPPSPTSSSPTPARTASSSSAQRREVANCSHNAKPFPTINSPSRLKRRPSPTQGFTQPSKSIPSASSACSKASTTSASPCATPPRSTHLKQSTTKQPG